MGSLLDFSSMSLDGGAGDDDFLIGVYRTRDNIANFRLRVRVRRAASSTPSSSSGSVPAAAGSEGAAGGSTESVRSSLEEGPGGEEDEKADMLDEAVISWQQKIFSEKEFQ